MPTFEELCSNAEAVAAAIENLARQLQRSAHSLKKAACDGNPGKIRSSAAQIEEAANRFRHIDVASARVWPLTDEQLTELLNGPYVDELRNAATAAGVSLSLLGDGTLAAFPAVLQVQPGKRALRLDAAKLTALRPSVVVERIRTRIRKPHSRPEKEKKFIEALFNAYKLVVGDHIERGAKLVDLYNALTLLPDVRNSYSKAEFTRDVYELDASGMRLTKDGATMSFPAATGTKSKTETLSIISPDGMPKYYFGIRFEKGS
jgi:hypothetical protein